MKSVITLIMREEVNAKMLKSQIRHNFDYI